MNGPTRCSHVLTNISPMADVTGPTAFQPRVTYVATTSSRNLREYERMVAYQLYKEDYASWIFRLAKVYTRTTVA